MSQPLAALPIRSRVPRIAEEAVRRARLSVVPRRIAEAPRVPFVTLLTAVVVAGVVGLLMFNTSMQQASFASTRLQEQAETLTARQQTLRMELDDLRDPQRVAEQAQRLGMVPAVTPAFLNLKDGSITGEPTVATPADGLRILPRAPRKPAILNPPPIVQEVLDTTASTSASTVPGSEDGKRHHKRNRR